MKHALYENPITHKFALLRLPDHFADGDTVPILPSDYWFSSREEAIAALSELFNQDDSPGAANVMSKE
jgi:hypothetical protein